MKKVSLVLFVIVVNFLGFADCILEKDVHVPPSIDISEDIRFSTTRTLDNGSLKKELLENLKLVFQVDVFVETGTYLGDTTNKAIDLFREVHTIELSKSLCAQAKKRFKSIENVFVHYGSSEKILESLLPNITGRILFYLDGHYSGHVTAKGSFHTPVLNELQEIQNSKKTNSIILIDDIRLFQPSAFPEKIRSLQMGLETYPDLAGLVVAILKINPNYQICFLGDALLAFPSDCGVFVSPVVRSCALERLESLCVDLSDGDLREASNTIGKAKHDEKEEIAIYYRTYSPFELEYGYRSYGTLWHALILLEEGDEERALMLLKDAVNGHNSRWSASQYIN